MSSKAITDAPPAPRAPQGAEVSPSVMREDDPGISRYIGLAGAFLVIFGGIFLVAQIGFSKGQLVGPGWATFALALGLVGLLYHAAFDRDVQFRRVYMAFSYAAILVGLALSVWPYPNKMGDQFPAGFLCLSLGLVFLLAFLRNEHEQPFRQYSQYVLLGVGGVLLAVGLIGGNINSDFLLGMGLLCCLLGLIYVFAFLSNRGDSDDLAYYVGLGLGGLGAVVFVIAAARSAFPGEAGAYLVPNGLLLMTVGGAAGLLSLGFCSELGLVVLTRRELAAFFYSPLAYFVLLAFTCAGWANFYFWIEPLSQAGRPVPEPIVRGFLFGFVTVLVTIVSIPVLTMRLFSEEKRTGTLEVMLTAPVDETLIVLSKYFASFFMYLLVWLPFVLFLVALRVMGGKPFDYRPMLAFFVVVLFTGSSMLSLGLFCSSLTRNQLISGVLTFTGTVLMTVVVFLGDTKSDIVLALEKHVAFVELWVNAMAGKLTPPGLLFHASLTVFFLFLTVKVLEARKWL